MCMWSATWPKEVKRLAEDFLGRFITPFIILSNYIILNNYIAKFACIMDGSYFYLFSISVNPGLTSATSTLEVGSFQQTMISCRWPL